MAALRRLPGIGEWTAQYIALRQLREPDAFPAADIGLMRALAQNGVRPSPADLLARAETWRPWRAYAALHLWASETQDHPRRRPSMTATQPETFILDRLAAPIGAILIAVDAQRRLSAVDFFNDEDAMRRRLRRQYGNYAAKLGQAAPAIREAFARYIAGDIHALWEIPVRTGGTVFQRKVWQALRTIPAGETRSYGQLAAQIGAPSAVRAVGLANGA